MDVTEITASIAAAAHNTGRSRAAVIAISGIDASGKGYATKIIDERLRSEGFNTAVINIDRWLNLPQVRFDEGDLAGNFYRNAIRFDDMFEQLVLPLKSRRSIDLIADLTEETANEYREHTYTFGNVDIILLEGIFLLKRDFLSLYDLKIWIDCSFETALCRAISRSQEGLPPEETIRAYKTIYFPAQQIHFELDGPRSVAEVIDNDRSWRDADPSHQVGVPRVAPDRVPFRFDVDHR